MKKINTNGDQCTSQQNAGFLDFIPDITSTVKSGLDPTMTQANYKNAELADFLARPVKIQTFSWSVNSSFEEIFDPWLDWATNPHVGKKLDNFFLFKGTLKVKFVINGSPFHYGKAIAAYHPLHSFSDLIEHSAIVSSNVNFVMTMIERSQRMNIRLDPSTDEGGCLCLPFIWPKNYIDVAIATQWQQLGQIGLSGMADLKTVSDSNQDVTISVFAWCDDAELSVPTYSISAQGDEVDSSSGFISEPASIVASIANKLTSVPVLRPFAMAAEIGASAIGSIAKIFGFSRPAYTGPISPMMRDPLGNLAHSSGADTTHKLTFDPKQAVTVDPRVVGLDGDDEMAIMTIAKRESYLTYFEWSAGDAVDSEQFFVSVNPSLGKFQQLTDQYSFQPTALSFATAPFMYWSGSLIYRFEIMASRYHKGRLKIAWDPRTLANARQADNFNVNYVQILDLEKTRNLEMTVSWGSNDPYKDANLPRNGTFLLDPQVVGNAAAIEFCNGYVSISVLNELICPSPVSAIRVNVYVRAGDDFELAAPINDYITNVSYRVMPESGDFQPPEGIETQGPPTTPEEAAQENDPDGADLSIPLVGEISTITNLKPVVFFGETFISFRNMLKRYNLATAYWTRHNIGPDQQNTYQFRYILPDFPSYYGYATDSLYTVAPGPPFDPSATTLMNYLTPAYLCQRGGIRSKYVAKSTGTISTTAESGVKNIKICRITEPESANIVFYQIQDPGVNYGLDPVTDVMNQSNYLQGAWTTLPAQQSVLAVEHPFYSPYRFRFAQSINTNSGIDDDNSDRFHHMLLEDRYYGNAPIPPVRGVAWERWIAAADDFSLHFFLNAPLLFVYDDPHPDISGENVI